MPEHATEAIRNVVLVGHGGVGKTTLAETLLHAAGATTRVGSVADGTAVLDREPEEVERHCSLSLGLASFDWTPASSPGSAYRINLLDAPGHPDFEAELDAALSVADLAVLVVSAVAGVEVGTELAWRKCTERRLPRIVFVTREDQHRADFGHVVEQLAAAFGSGFAELELPLGEEEAFHGVADVLAEQAHEYGRDGSHRVAEIPAELADREHAVHEHTVEEIVAGDDAQLARYLDGDEPSVGELEATLAAEVAGCSEFPVLVGSGLTGVGVDRLLDYVCTIGPAPRPVEVLAGDRAVELTPDPSADPLLYVFKTLSDPYVGQVSLFKVLTGTLRPDTTLRDSGTGTEVRVHGLSTVVGSNHAPVARLVAGDIGAASKLDVATGATLAPTGRPVRMVPPERPRGYLAVALVPATQSDEDKLPAAVQRIAREDPALVVGHDELSRRTVLRGLGDAHLAVTVARLGRKFGVHVTTEDVRVPYRRTIGSRVEVEGRLKKQSGGHGQYAVVKLVVSPLPRGGGFEFVDAIVGGAIPKNYVAAVHAGIEELMTSGGHAGVPVVDVRVECVDGKTHSVDSSDMAFRTAAQIGFQEALERGGEVILEPVSLVTVAIPSALQGDVLGDLSARRGRIVGTDSEGGQHVISAHVPTAELARYPMDLRAIAGGRASLDIGHSHYDACPDHVAVAARRAMAGA